MEAVCEVQHVNDLTSAASVKQAQSGDTAAFERLYRENADRIYALCLRMAGNSGEAEELTQDIFVHAWKKLGSFRGDSAFSTWLHRLAVNVVLTARRSDKRRTARVMTTGDMALFERGGRPERVGDRMDLDREMANLPEASRTVFVMHEIEGYTHEEIARLTGRAEGTCKTLLHRARKQLRERLSA